MTPVPRENEITTARRRLVPLGGAQETDAAPPPGPAPLEPITSFRVVRLDQPGTVVIEPAVPPPAPEASGEEPAVPRRAVPLAPPTAKELAAARDLAHAAARPRLDARAAAVKARRPAIENKLAGAADSEEILRMMDVEVTLQRARRLSGAGDKQREFLRVLSILMLFGLMVVVVGAMWYLETLKEGRASLGRQRADSRAAAPPRNP